MPCHSNSLCRKTYWPSKDGSSMCLVSRVSPSYISNPPNLPQHFYSPIPKQGACQHILHGDPPKAYNNPVAGPHSQISSRFVCICDKFPGWCWSWKPHREPLTSKIRSHVQCQTREATSSKTTASYLKGEPNELRWLDSSVNAGAGMAEPHPFLVEWWALLCDFSLLGFWLSDLKSYLI